MGIDQTPRGGLAGKAAVLFALALLGSACVPAAATVYSNLYSSSTGTVRAPSVVLQAGTAGSSSISTVAADAATAATTASLTYYASANAPTSSVAVDGSSSAATLGKKTSLALTIATTQANDVIYLAVTLPTGTPVTTVTDTSSLSWALRQTEDANGVRLETWYAASASALASDTVTVSVGSNTKFSASIMGVSGANTASPFDPNFSAATIGTGSGSTASVSVSTLYPDDLVVAAISAASGAGVTPVAPLTLVAPTQSPQETDGMATEVVTSLLSSAPLSFTLSSAVGWAMIADAFSEAPPAITADTTLAAPGASGSFALPSLSSAYLWSPAYGSAANLYSGSWTLDLWASGASAGSLNVGVYVVNAANSVLATLVSAGSTGSFGTTKGEVVTSLTLVPGATIPSGDRIMVVLTAPSGGPASFTVYWGASQLSSFSTPAAFNYVLALSNPTSSPWTVSMGVASSSGVSRLNNMTVKITEPASSPYALYSQQIAVLSGGVTKSQGAAVALAASTTMYVYVYAAAATQGSSTFVISLEVQNGASSAYSSYTIDLAVN